MTINRAAAGVVVAACLIGGAGGAYFASRADQPPAPPDEQLVALPSAPDLPEAVPPVVEPPPAAPPAATRPAPAPRPAPAAPRAAAPPAPVAPAPLPDFAAAAPEPEPEVLVPTPTAAREPFAWVEPEGPIYDELTVVAESVIGLQTETSLSSETAQVEDRVVARVTRDVRVGDRVAIPAGARAEGEVTLVDRGGRVREQARLGVRFTTIVLSDGTRLSIDSETIYREGDAPGAESAATIGGGAIGGAIIGGILGGARGAAIGGSAGAGAGTAAVLAGGRNPATLPAGSPVTVRLERPVTVIVEH